MSLFDWLGPRRNLWVRDQPFGRRPRIEMLRAARKSCPGRIARPARLGGGQSRPNNRPPERGKLASKLTANLSENWRLKKKHPLDALCGPAKALVSTVCGLTYGTGELTLTHRFPRRGDWFRKKEGESGKVGPGLPITESDEMLLPSQVAAVKVKLQSCGTAILAIQSPLDDLLPDAAYSVPNLLAEFQANLRLAIPMEKKMLGLTSKRSAKSWKHLIAKISNGLEHSGSTHSQPS